MSSEIVSDLRFGVRKLARSPGFTFVAVAMLALGIGANAAIFSFIDALLIKTLPVADPDRLVILGPGAVGVTGFSDSPQTDTFSYAQLEAFEQRKDIFSAVAAAPTFMATLQVAADDSQTPERTAGQVVSGEYFDMLDIAPFAGRFINAADSLPASGGRVAVLSHQFWQRRLDGDPDVIGRTLLIQNEPFQIVGIAPAFYRGHFLEQSADLWLPLSAQPVITGRPSMLTGQPRANAYWLNIIGRLAPGVAIQQAEELVNAEILRVNRVEGGSEPRDFHLALTPGARGISSLRGRLRMPLSLLYGGAALLLLIVCANLANLLLARASDRRGEIGIRLALGAGMGRLARQLLSESFLLGAAGAALGFAVASWLMPVIRGMIAEIRGPNLVAAQLDYRVLLVGALVSLSTVLLFGLAPALWSLRHSNQIAGTTRTGGSEHSRRHVFAKNALVAGQAALSLFLLCCTGLLLRSLVELRSVDLGIAAQNVYYFRLDADNAPAQNQDAVRTTIIQQAREIPGVESVAFIGSAPMSGNFGSSTTEIPGYEPAPDENMNVIYDHVTEGYFDALRIPLISGRFLELSDRYDSACVVSQAFASRFFPGGSPVGQTIRKSSGRGDHRDLFIVGVVGDVRHVNLRDDPPPVVYQSSTGYESPLDTLLVRTAGDPASVGAQIRATVLAAAPGISMPLTPTRLADFVNRSTRVESLLSELAAAFAGLALLLAALGIYGLLSYSVRQRSGEFGVRQALGARRPDIIRLVLRQAGFTLASGGLVGLMASLFAGRLLGNILYGVDPHDPIALGASLAALIAAGLIAAYAPARRAASVNPADLLRQE